MGGGKTPGVLLQRHQHKIITIFSRTRFVEVRPPRGLEQHWSPPGLGVFEAPLVLDGQTPPPWVNPWGLTTTSCCRPAVTPNETPRSTEQAECSDGLCAQ